MFRHLRAELAAAPTVAFVAADALNSLYPALAIAGAVALAGFGWRLRQRQSLRGALAGLLRRAGGDGDRGDAG